MTKSYQERIEQYRQKIKLLVARDMYQKIREALSKSNRSSLTLMQLEIDDGSLAGCRTVDVMEDDDSGIALNNFLSNLGIEDVEDISFSEAYTFDEYVFTKKTSFKQFLQDMEEATT